MAKKKLGSQADATAPLKRYAKVVLGKAGGGGDKAHSGDAGVRRAEHAGHTIAIATRYEIRVDGKKLALHLSVGDDGNLVCHAMPNYLFKSAVDLVKGVIDAYPDDFLRKGAKRSRALPVKRRGGSHRGHG